MVLGVDPPLRGARDGVLLVVAGLTGSVLAFYHELERWPLGGPGAGVRKARVKELWA